MHWNGTQIKTRIETHFVNMTNKTSTLWVLFLLVVAVKYLLRKISNGRMSGYIVEIE